MEGGAQRKYEYKREGTWSKLWRCTKSLAPWHTTKETTGRGCSCGAEKMRCEIRVKRF